MRTFMKILGGLLLLVVVVVGGAAAYWMSMDASKWKGELTALASQQLGRTLTISGELTPTFSLSNGFGLRVTGVTLANAAGFQPTNMLSVNELELVVDVMAVLNHKIHVKKFLLKDADITLEARNSGNNWTFDNMASSHKPAADGAGTAEKPSIAADTISIENLSLVHVQNGVRKDYKITLLDIAAAENEPVSIALAATADGKPISLNATAGSLAAIESGQKQKIDAELTFGDISLTVVADYRRAGDEHNFSNLTLDYNGIKATGNIALNLAGAVPTVMADIAVPVIDFAALGGTGQGGGTSAADKDAPLFSRNPLPWDALKSVNANVALDIKQLLNGAKSYGPANLQLKLQNGGLGATVITQPPGATKPITAKVQANAARTAQIYVDAPGLDAATLASWLGQDEPLVQAPAHFNLNIAGAGISLHDVMASSNGALQLDFAPGKLNSSALPTALSAVLASLIGAEKFNNAAVACLKADFGIQNGIATARGLGTASSVLNASGDGLVSLRDETINLRFVVDATSTAKQIPLLPVGITGSLKNPTVAADTKALTGQVIGKVVDNVAGKFGGLANTLLGGSGGKAQVEKPFNPCRPNDKPEPQPAAAATPAAPATQLQDVLKNPDAAKDIIKDPTKLLNMFGGQ